MGCTAYTMDVTKHARSENALMVCMRLKRTTYFASRSWMTSETWFVSNNRKEIMDDKEKSPIKSGWRGNINGHIEGTDGTQIGVSEITLKLDHATAWALANHLTDNAIKAAKAVEGAQITALSNLGAALGRLIDHSVSNNGGRSTIK